MQLAQNYFITEDEKKFLSKLVEKQISEYNMLILENLGIITDLCVRVYRIVSLHAFYILIGVAIFGVFIFAL